MDTGYTDVSHTTCMIALYIFCVQYFGEYAAFWVLWAEVQVLLKPAVPQAFLFSAQF
jgi:hypothetical protein